MICFVSHEILTSPLLSYEDGKHALTREIQTTRNEGVFMN